MNHVTLYIIVLYQERSETERRVYEQVRWRPENLNDYLIRFSGKNLSDYLVPLEKTKKNLSDYLAPFDKTKKNIRLLGAIRKKNLLIIEYWAQCTFTTRLCSARGIFCFVLWNKSDSSETNGHTNSQTRPAINNPHWRNTWRL